MIAHHSYSLVELYRALVLGCGAFTIGLGIYLAWTYWRQVLWPSRPYDARAHVLAIVVSYVLLLVALEAEILHRAVDRDPPTWRLAVGTIAFPLGAYALTRLVKIRAKDPKPEDPGEEGAV